MHGPACIFWANLTPFSLQAGGKEAALIVEFELQWLGKRVLVVDEASPYEGKAGLVQVINASSASRSG